jgi:hypothetical protein
MRLTKEQEQRATDELIGLLTTAGANGLATREMVGTKSFHGARTLTHKQIARLLRKTGRTSERVGGQGSRTFTIWRLK